jgi:hypothetical protein
MKKYIFAAGLFVGLSISSVSADALKNSLNSMLKEKDTTPSMVSLDNVMNAKPKPVKKSRSSKAVVATVNGHKIRKKEADAYLKKVTGGKVSDFDALPKKQRMRLIKELALPLLVAQQAKRELSSQEQEMVLSRMWMRKEAMKIKVTDDEAQKAYAQMKQKAVENNASDKIPEFEKVKNNIKGKLIENKILGTLMKDVRIKVQ